MKGLYGSNVISQKPSHSRPTYPNGVTCKLCNMLNEYGEPNQKDGTYVCYECK